MTNPGMKCSRCKGPARHRFPQHNARFCDECLAIFVRRQVEKAIKGFAMLEPGQTVAVAISGGKDSLALWQILLELEYDVRAMHIDLGLGGFSQRSAERSRAMAEMLGQELTVFRMEDLAGSGVEDIARASRRQPCSACGTLKRSLLNRLTFEMGADTVATGHHLDDEAGRLLGNMIRGHQMHLDRQWPVLEGLAPAVEGGLGLARKVKPLCRLGADEIKSYAKSKGLPALSESCPRSKGATLPYYQEAVNLLEQRMPGTKRDLYLGFLRRKGGPPDNPAPAGACSVCGAPTFQETCTACTMIQRARDQRLEREQRDASH